MNVASACFECELEDHDGPPYAFLPMGRRRVPIGVEWTFAARVDLPCKLGLLHLLRCRLLAVMVDGTEIEEWKGTVLKKGQSVTVRVQGATG